MLDIIIDPNHEVKGTSEAIGCSFKDLIKVVYPGLKVEIGGGNSGDGLTCMVKAVFEDKL